MKQKVHGAQKGFTLIELLIVITIIGILAAALLPNVFGATAKARDAARLADLNQMVTAIESYNGDSSAYPLATDIYGGALAKYFQGGKVVTDPSSLIVVSNGTPGQYFYCKVAPNTFGVTYVVAAKLENPTGKANGLSSNLGGLCTGNDAGDTTKVASTSSTANDVYFLAK